MKNKWHFSSKHPTTKSFLYIFTNVLWLKMVDLIRYFSIWCMCEILKISHNIVDLYQRLVPFFKNMFWFHEKKNFLPPFKCQYKFLSDYFLLALLLQYTTTLLWNTSILKKNCVKLFIWMNMYYHNRKIKRPAFLYKSQ